MNFQSNNAPLAYNRLKAHLETDSRLWLVTGVAGFIGSNLLESLLNLNQRVVGLDNFSTGHQKNLDEVRGLTGKKWKNFTFIEGDIRDIDVCRTACNGIDYVLHQAALGSVPRSLADPVTTNAVNVSGFLNMLVAAREASVKSFTYAASSSTYGDHPNLPKVEDTIGRPLSPYAVTKYVNELYSDVFFRSYQFGTIGLRYFNVFGPRQDPDGAYAAVIPKWISSLLRGDDVVINGSGETSRDFCFIENVIQANLLAATTCEPNALNQVFNVALGERTTLNELYDKINDILRVSNEAALDRRPIHRDFRAGDVLHSLADISKAKRLLGYSPQKNIDGGLQEAMPWYVQNSKKERLMRN